VPTAQSVTLSVYNGCVNPIRINALFIEILNEQTGRLAQEGESSRNVELIIKMFQDCGDFNDRKET
jgi:hypothetical protein